MSASRAPRIERDAGLERFHRSRVHLVDRPERVGQQAAHEIEPVLGDLDVCRFHAVAELIQGHASPPVCGRIPRPRAQRGGGFMTRAYRFLSPIVLLDAVCSWTPPSALAQGNLNVYCSVQAEWCQAVANEFQRQSGFKTVGIYAGALGFGYNPELLQRKKLPPPTCWRDLVKPEYRDEIQVANPNSSGTAYTAIATIVQLFGEEEAFRYLRQLHRNVNSYTRSGVGPIKAVARGETSVSISFMHDGVTEAVAGFPVKIQAPCEGTGYEVGSLSIIKGARNLDGAKKFADWALTAPAQKLGGDAKQFQVPSNREALLPPQAPKFAEIKLISYDFAKYGSAAERKRLLDRWEKEVNSQAK